MKKLLSSLLAIAVLFVSGGNLVYAETNMNNSPVCIAFDDVLYYAKDTWLRTSAEYSGRKDLKDAEKKVVPQVARLHDLLEQEGFIIAKKEKDINQYGRTTTIAVAGLQNKYKEQLLTSQGLSYPYGVLDEKAVAFLNAKYPCPTRVPSTSTASSTVKFGNEGKTVTLKEKTLLNAGYVVAKVNGNATTTFSYINKSTGAETVVDENYDKNGKYILGTVVPAPGTYTVRAKIAGNTKVSEFTLVSTAETVTPGTMANPAVVRFSSRGDVVRLKETTLLNAQYAITKALEPATTTFTYINKTSGAETVVRTIKQGNGRYLLNTIVPPTGTYTVRAKVEGATGKSEFTLISLPANSSNTQGDQGSNNSGSNDGLDTGNGTSMSNSITITSPKADASVKVGGVVLVKATGTNIPLNSKLRVYLTGNGSDIQIGKDRTVRSCPPAPGDCANLLTNGVRATLPKTIMPGSYRMKAVITLSDGLTVEDSSDSFNVTN